MKSETIPTLVRLPKQVRYKLDMLDHMREVETGRSNHKTQIVSEAIEDIWKKYSMQNIQQQNTQDGER